MTEAQKPMNPLNERQSLAELRMICIAANLPVKSSDPSLLEPEIEVEIIVLKWVIIEGQNPKVKVHELPQWQPKHGDPAFQMSSPRLITVMTASSRAFDTCKGAAYCRVLTLFRVATLLHEMVLLAVGLSAELRCSFFDWGRLILSGHLSASFTSLHKTKSLSVPWCSGLDLCREKDSKGYLWFWGECGGDGDGGGVGGVFWFTLSGVKVVDRRMGAGDSQGVQGTEVTGGATSSK